MIPLFDNIPARRFSVVNYTIIGVNLLIFFYEVGLVPDLNRFMSTWGMTPASVVTYLVPWQPGSVHVATTLLTSMFIHGGWTHLLGNMLFLWIFGDNVEDAMGRLRYLFFYILSGLGAAALQIYVDPSSSIPTLGASGAISGVLGAYILLYPRARVSTLLPWFFFFTIVKIPAVLLLGIWFLLQFLSGVAEIAFAGSSVGGVAWWAHIGGFVLGMLLMPLFRQR